MKRVAHVITKFAPAAWAGAETSIVEVSRQLPEHGYDPTVLSVLAFSDERRGSVGGVPVRRFRGFYPAGPRHGWSHRRDAAIGAGALSPGLLGSVLFEQRPDIVHIHAHNRLGTTVALACRARHIPYVYTVHSLYRPDRRALVRNTPLSYDAGLRHAAAVITVARRDAREVVASGAVAEDRVTVIPNGVDTYAFASGNGEAFRRRLGLSDRPLLLQVGRVCELKNQAFSIRLVDALKRRGTPAALVIIGGVSEDSYLAHLRSLVDELGLARDVLVLPQAPAGGDELRDAYAAANAVLLPSLHEAQPVVMLEAWAAGRPVIALDGWGADDQLRSGCTGEVIPRSMCQEQAAELVAGVLVRTDSYADPARAAAGDHAWDRITARIAGVYDRVGVLSEARSSPDARHPAL